jgi:hypothetical protein
VLHGASRGGKTALLAGATDDLIADLERALAAV